jgi:uncharacterized protein involved in cysteine biosynthesis
MKKIRDSVLSFYYGFTLPIRAFRLIARKKRLMVWSALPIFLTLGLSIWGVAWVKAKAVAAGMAWVMAKGYAADSFAVHAAVLLLQITLFVLAAVTFSFIAGIVASPFNDFLAEATEPFTDPPLAPSNPRLREKLRAFVIDLVKTGIVTSMQIILLFIGLLAIWIPGVNIIPFAAAFWLLAYQFVTYPQTRRGEGVGASVVFLKRHFFATFGFGASLGFLFAIPVLSSFALPLAVVGGTLLYARAGAPETPERTLLR